MQSQLHWSHANQDLFKSIILLNISARTNELEHKGPFASVQLNYII